MGVEERDAVAACRLLGRGAHEREQRLRVVAPRASGSADSRPLEKAKPPIGNAESPNCSSRARRDRAAGCVTAVHRRMARRPVLMDVRVDAACDWVRPSAATSGRRHTGRACDVDRPFRAAEQAPRLVRREVGHDLARPERSRRRCPRSDGSSSPTPSPCGRRSAAHRHAVTLDHRGPVLVAERMAELDAGAHRDLGRFHRRAPSRWITITSRSVIRATTARRARSSHSRTSPSRRKAPRSSDTAISRPLAVFLRKRFFCASQ